MPDKDQDFLSEVRDWYRQAAAAEADVRRDMLDDLKFVRLGGEQQWPDYALASRRIPGAERPVLTINWLKRYRTTIINQLRQRTPAIKVRPVDDHADHKTAEILQGVIRNIEHVSRAAHVLDKAIEWSVDCGRGYIALQTKYIADDSFTQELAFRLIPDPFKVYLDPWTVEADGSDARKGIIIEDMPREAFEQQYPDAVIEDWPEGAPGDREWLDEDNIRLAEYYEIIETPQNLLMLADGRVLWEDELKEGDEPVAVRRSVRKRCHWCKIAGNQVLERGIMPTQYLPIIPVYGEEYWLDGKHEIMGAVRPAKDPQRMFNFWMSALAEQVALQPKMPWIGPEGFMEGHERDWAISNVANLAALEYRAFDEMGRPLERPSRQPAPPIPTGYTEQMQVALDGIRAAVGMEDPMIGAGQGPDQSGRAIRSLQEQGAIATMHYGDNLSKSLAHAGRILLEMIPKVYDTPQVLRIIGEDGAAEHAEHDPNLPQAMAEVREESGAVRRIYNLSVGRYDCIATAGPSYSSKRQEGFDALAQLVQAMPQLGQLAGDLLVRLSDIPYADEIADRLKAALPPQLLAATEGEEDDPDKAALKQQLMMMMEQLQQATDARQLQQAELDLKAGELSVKQFDAETKRMAVLKPPATEGPDQFDIDERLTKLMLAAEKAQREQEAHERAMAAPLPVPTANDKAGRGPITGE